jgi:8-oxo-dGTP pyrophosphatase MutT (NUDIX family)
MKKTSTTQFGTLPYRKTKGGEIRVLLVTSSAGRWTVPKGWPERNDSPLMTAARETFEEAGATGKLGKKPLASYRRSKKPSRKSTAAQVVLFPLEVTHAARSWPEKCKRARRWFSRKSACSAVSNSTLRSMLANFDIPRKSD